MITPTSYTFNELQKITTLTNKLKLIERKIKVVGLDRYENSAEHSFQVALLAWRLADLVFEGMDDYDLELIFAYSLVHDLVEVYANDISVFSSDEELINQKAQEQKALDKITKEFWDFSYFI